MNKQDAALLQSGEWRDKVSDLIMTAVENYFSNQDRAPADVTAPPLNRLF